MAKEQKGFIVYGDVEPVVDRLSDEEAGKLLKGMVNYFNTGKEPDFSGILEFVFIPIKQQMDRDADKYVKRCEKMRENVNKRWSKDTKVYNGIQMYTNDTNTNTNTDTNTDTTTNTDTNTDTTTNTDTNTDTTTNTNTKSRGGGSDGDVDDRFNIWKMMTPEDVDAVYDAYPESGGNLIQAVFEDVRDKKKRIKKPVEYILGYAKKVGWDDNANHGGAS